MKLNNRRITRSKTFLAAVQVIFIATVLFGCETFKPYQPLISEETLRLEEFEAKAKKEKEDSGAQQEEEVKSSDAESKDDLKGFDAFVKKEDGEGNKPKEKAAKYNHDYIEKTYKGEEKFYKNHNKDGWEPPKNCLALSGGGMRSAAFSIGVMKGLQIHDQMEKVDIISGVSGGSYALSWYITQRSEFYDQNDELFGLGSFKNVKFNGGNSLGRTLTKESGAGSLINFFTIAGEVLRALAYIPANTLFNGLLNYNVETNPVKSKYEDSISDLFQSDIIKSNNQIKLIRSKLLNVKGKCEEGENCPADLKSILEKLIIEDKKIPYFIVNTTSSNRFLNPYTSLISPKKNLREVFEFTPLFYGNDSYEYNKDEYVSLDRSTSLSGAVNLSSATSYLGALAVLNLDLGRYIPVYKNKDDPLQKGAQAVKNFPVLNYIHPWAEIDSKMDLKERLKLATDIYLTDGAGSESLAAFSVIKRMCKNITVVDATWDPYYEFKHYKYLKKELDKNMGIDLTIPVLDRVLKIENQPKREGRVQIHPVMKGKVKNIVRKVGSNIQEDPLNITYIKLAMDPDWADLDYYGEAVEGRKNRSNKLKKAYSCVGGCFPQQWTLDQNFDYQQFNAYRDLGCRLVEIYLDKNLDMIKDVAPEKSPLCYNDSKPKTTPKGNQVSASNNN